MGGNSMKTFLILLFAAVMTITQSCAGEVTLVRDGRPEAGIVIDKKSPTRAAQLAAFELQHVIKQITGAEVPIVGALKDFKGVAILVGESDATRKLKIPDKAFKGEEYLVEFAKNKIILIGKDSLDYGKVDYADYRTFPSLMHNYRSTTYAVYDFLEKCCGVRFYSFGDAGTALEKRKTLNVKPVSIRRAPTMDAFRRPFISSRFTRNLLKRDVQLLMLRWRVNTMFGEVNHNVFSIYYRYWGKAIGRGMDKLFIEKRPEYFAQGYKGKFSLSSIHRLYPDDPDLPPQLCTTHPGPVEYFADEAFKAYKGEQVAGAPYSNMPRMEDQPWYYPIQEDDSSFWCKCEKCQNSFPSIKPERKYNYLHFDWANRIAAAAAKRDRAIGISTLAYSGTLFYPDPKVLKLRPNVMVQLCLGIHSWYHPGVYGWQHKVYREWVEKEVNKRPLTVWVYLLCPYRDAKLIHKYNQFFPTLYPWHAGRYFKEFAEDGIRGYFAEVNAIFHLLEAYVGNKVCFDSTVDTDKLIDEYFVKYYGNAAEPMRRFYRTIEDITWDPKNYPVNAIRRVRKSSTALGYHTEKVNWHIGTPERIGALQKIIDQAQKQAATPLEKQRVKLFVDNIWTQAVEGRKAFEAREKIRAVPVPRITADYAGECDGALNKVDFSKAARSGGWTTIEGDKLATRPELLFASDSKYLYLKYHEKGDVALKYNDEGLWMNNVEIFLAGKPNYPYGQLAFSPKGEFKALRHQVIEGVIRMNKWPIKPVIKNELDKNGWTFAMAIPLKQLLPNRPVAPGERIYANFMRTRRFDDMASWSWSPIFAKGYSGSLYRMGVIYTAPPAREGLLPVNGDFKSASGNLPDGWVHNKSRDFEPHGKITLSGGRMNILSRGKRVCVYYQKVFPARRGDRLILEFTARGTGKGSVGAYFYGGGADGAGSRLNDISVTGEPKKYKIVLTVANYRPSRFTNGFRPVLGVTPGSHVEYSQLKVSVIARGKQP